MSRTERQFLHDLSSPISVALGMLERLAEHVADGGDLDDRDRERVAKAFSALIKIKEMITARRAELLASDPESDGRAEPAADESNAGPKS